MKRALIVVSTWCPAFLADMHRVRMIAGKLRDQGWEAEILSPDSSFQPPYALESGVEKFFPDLPLHEVRAWQPRFFRAIGFGTIGWRALVPLDRMARRLLRTKRFDVVYFSTTVHLLTCLGSRWRKLYGVPYAADLHDPIYFPKRRYTTTTRPLKSWVASRLNRGIEAMALGESDALVSVSRGYVEDLRSRYPAARWSDPNHLLVQPFPADIEGLALAQPLKPVSESRRVVYVGAGGTIMESGWCELLTAIKQTGSSAAPHIELYGTSSAWRPGIQGHLEKVAWGHGLRGTVEESPARVPYQESLGLIKGADGLLVLGVDDPNYQPSKLHTYLASGLPVLVTARVESDLAAFAQQAGPGVYCVKFGEVSERQANLEAVRSFFADVQAARSFRVEQRSVLHPHRAAAEHAEFLMRMASAPRPRADAALGGRST